MTMSIAPIETVYNGYRFRSRLEARWAVFFDTLGVTYEYEKEGYDLGEAGWYLPDFWLPKHDTWVEIKGECLPEDLHKFHALETATGKQAFLVEGTIGEHTWHTTGLIGQGLTRPLTDINQIDCGYRMFFNNETTAYGPAGWGEGMCCPICATENVHFNKSTFQSSDTYSAWEGRGDAIRIPMWGECSHTWTLRFGEHKGCAYLAIENVQEQVIDLGMELAGWDENVYQAAIARARAARFERGK